MSELLVTVPYKDIVLFGLSAWGAGVIVGYALVLSWPCLVTVFSTEKIDSLRHRNGGGKEPCNPDNHLRQR